MRRRTLGNGAIIAASLLTLTGLGVAIANAATNSGDPAASASASSSASAGPSTTVSPSASSSGSTSGGSECADVFLTTAPAGDTVGKLCTTVEADGTSLSGVTVTFTASSTCSGTVMLRVSGVDSSGVEFGKVEKVACTSGKATASFTPATTVASDTFLCGTLLADKYTAAQACVAIA